MQHCFHVVFYIIGTQYLHIRYPGKDYAKRSGRGAARRGALGRNFRTFLQNVMYGIFISLFGGANAAVASGSGSSLRFS